MERLAVVERLEPGRVVGRLLSNDAPDQNKNRAASTMTQRRRGTTGNCSLLLLHVVNITIMASLI